jgi:hypothetical protein
MVWMLTDRRPLLLCGKTSSRAKMLGVVMDSVKKRLRFSDFSEMKYIVIRRSASHVIITCPARLLPMRQVARFGHTPEL